MRRIVSLTEKLECTSLLVRFIGFREIAHLGTPKTLFQSSINLNTGRMNVTKRIVSVTAVVALALLAMASVATADVPTMMQYQGFLTDEFGEPLNDTLSMTFKIYDHPTAGVVIWTETQADVIVANGLFHVLLGSVNPISDTVFAETERWLGITVAPDPEISPRTRLVTVPYAFRVATVDGATGGVISGDVDIQSDLTVSGKATIGPGHTNTGLFAFVAGQNNTAGSRGSTVSGGEQNLADSTYATVSGGYADTASGWRSTVSGGAYNKASNSGSVIGGGWGNVASGYASTVGGGLSDTASGSGSTVGGGNYNVAEGSWSTVAGGHFNIANGYESTVGGGYYDTASGHGSTVCGGSSNHANGTYSAIGGGILNSNAGDRSAIPGGSYDTLTSNANWSMAFGNGVYINTPYRAVFFDSVHSGRLGINRDDHNGGISYPIHVGTDGTNGNGAYLSADGQWHDASSKAFKTDFHPLDGEEILMQISNVPVESWRYKGTQGWHIGPYAEDFAQAFGVGTLREDGTVDNQYLAPSDVAGVALAGVKELAQQNQELRQVIEQLKRSNSLLEARVAELEKAR